MYKLAGPFLTVLLLLGNGGFGEFASSHKDDVRGKHRCPPAWLKSLTS